MSLRDPGEVDFEMKTDLYSTKWLLPELTHVSTHSLPIKDEDLDAEEEASYPTVVSLNVEDLLISEEYATADL